VLTRTRAVVMFPATVILLESARGGRARKAEEPLVAATVSMTTLLSVATLLGRLYLLPGLTARTG
jgi:hypothetical protein